jgi:hypothetical protein
MKTKIKIGDIVSVHFHNVRYTLCTKAEVVNIPCATGDSWIFYDTERDITHYVSEGCTVTKYNKLEQ